MTISIFRPGQPLTAAAKKKIALLRLLAIPALVLLWLVTVLGILGYLPHSARWLSAVATVVFALLASWFIRRVRALYGTTPHL